MSPDIGMTLAGAVLGNSAAAHFFTKICLGPENDTTTSSSQEKGAFIVGIIGVVGLGRTDGTATFIQV